MYSELEKFEIKAFEVVLAQKQRIFQGISSSIAGYSKKCRAICYYGKN